MYGSRIFTEEKSKICVQFLLTSAYRNCIINMDEVTVYDNGDFVMSNQERIPVYRKLRTDMKQAYADYIFAKMNRGS